MARNRKSSRTTSAGFSSVSGSGKNLSEHELAQRMTRILEGSSRGAQTTRAYADFAHKHADEFKRETGIDLTSVSDMIGKK